MDGADGDMSHGQTVFQGIYDPICRWLDGKQV
ncbi:hypothetical protein NKDENANG_01767 [Candidatus Entotheonellaceae bacterium PAL068K]